MAARLTERMEAWIETGCQIAVASPDGKPTVVIAPSATVLDGGQVAFPLDDGAVELMQPALAENPQVAFGVSGKMRAPYQFKGSGSIVTDGEADRVVDDDPAAVLTVTVTEIYCTKPGAEAGKRLDTMPFEALQAWEAERWTDLPPA